jgi:hypothetical protein
MGLFKLGSWEADNWGEDPLKKQKKKKIQRRHINAA